MKRLPPTAQPHFSLRCAPRAHDQYRRRRAVVLVLLVGVALAAGCRRRPAEERKVSAVTVIGVPVPQRFRPIPQTAKKEQPADRTTPIVARVPGDEYDIWPSGYVQAYRIEPRTDRRLSIEEPDVGPAAWGDKLWVDGKEVTDFVYDFRSLKTTNVASRIGSLGKHAEVKGRSLSTQIEKTLSLEVYDDFPNMAVEQLTYLNLGSSDLQIDRVQAQRHRLDASITNVQAARSAFWSFHGTSIEPGRDAVFPIPPNFSQRNVMAAPVAVKAEIASVGGGVPVVALWTATLGVAIGHVEPAPQMVAFPVHTLPDGDVEIYMEFEPAVRLKPGEQYATPRSFVTTYTGDYYEPLSLYSKVLSRQLSPPVKPRAAAFGADWSGRADDPGMGPAQIIAAIPEIKALNIRRATLDGRWFDAAGDWEPRGENFSTEAIQRMVVELHKQGILAGLAWTPLAVEDAEGSRKSSGSLLAREHPEWLILESGGRHARMAHNLAVLCPAVPEVREYTRRLVTRFVQQWGFDALRLEDAYTVPECHNPAHHHESSQDSLRALGEMYREIMEVARSLRPETTVEICPCGTPPNFAWLPYQDIAATGEPANSAQLRHLLKMYKSLLGSPAAIAAGTFDPRRTDNAGLREDIGRYFAPIIGLGAVPGARFTWPADGNSSRQSSLTPEKEARLKKWFKIYNDLMLSQGDFQNLYVTGFDDPEGYVIQKSDKTYYAFFSSQPDRPWKGELELRGLKRGRFRVFDYADGKKLGTATSPLLRIPVQFTGFLLIEVSLEK